MQFIITVAIIFYTITKDKRTMSCNIIPRYLNQKPNKVKEMYKIYYYKYQTPFVIIKLNFFSLFNLTINKMKYEKGNPDASIGFKIGRNYKIGQERHDQE